MTNTKTNNREKTVRKGGYKGNFLVVLPLTKIVIEDGFRTYEDARIWKDTMYGGYYNKFVVKLNENRVNDI
jgi:hypothetical protein